MGTSPEFGVHWKYKAPGAPGEKEVRVHLAEQWPSIDAKLRDSDGRTFSSPTGGARGNTPSSSTAAAPAPTVQGADSASILKALMPPKKAPLPDYMMRCRYCRKPK